MTRDELKAKATGRYAGAMKLLLLGENPFPLSIPYKRPSRTGDPAALIRLKTFLRGESKAQNGFGPTIGFSAASTRKFGDGVLADEISFDSLDDLTRYIDKKSEADRVLAHAAVITQAFPPLREWTSRRLRRLADESRSTWEGIIEAVRYFAAHPKPWVYPREVPLGLHTKFLEENYALVIDLLSEVAPEALNATYANWQDRLGLRSSSDMIEGRFLDPTVAHALPRHMVTPATEWNRCAPDPRWILIVENRTTLLSLPVLKGCLALLGKGYAVRQLAQLAMLTSCPVHYWGDIDQHGFEILASLRSVVPGVQSCLMDEATLNKCRSLAGRENVDGTLAPDFVSTHLQTVERTLWHRCASEHLRLEQENIPVKISTAVLEPLAKASGNPAVA